MTILITGAAGFIASHLARSLIWQGINVIGIDNFNNYYPRQCKEFNLDLNRLAANSAPIKTKDPELPIVYSKLKQFYLQSSSNALASNPGNFTFIEADITNFQQLEDIFKQNEITSVIHLAAMAGVPKSTAQPLLYTKVNVQGTANLLELASIFQISKFLFASSSSVYGNKEKDSFFVSESDHITKPSSVYGATKVAGEVLCHAFHKSKNLNCAIVRVFGPIYGPLQRPYGMLHQRAINYTHNNKTLKIYGQLGLDTAKDATYIDDEIQGFLKILNSDFKFEIYNIGTQNPLSIKHCIGCIENVFNQHLNIQIVDSDQADVASSANISKAKEKLNYLPKFSMSEGIKRQIEVFNLMPKWYQKMELV
jgi:UDP-glucuronate 4-epimerase